MPLKWRVFEFEVIDTSISTLSLLATEGENIKARTILYPNPAKSGASIKSTDGSTISNIFIFDLFGKKVREYSGKLNWQQSLDLKGMAKGIYVVKIHTGDAIETKKLVME